ncbi:MAG: 50S ribosomal protein L25 [Planctomycetota bacterium]
MDIPTLKGEPRKAAGTRAAKRLRLAGKLPAIVYGHKTDPLSLTLDYHDVELNLEHGAHVVNLDLNGEVQPCLFKDAQYDHLGIKLLHVDFTRVRLDERVKVHVQIELRGQAKGVAEGGVLHQELAEIEIECPAMNIPEKIRVDVSDLAIDDVLHVKDLAFDEGHVATSDPETVVATVREPLVQEEEEVAADAAAGEAPAAGAGEPEVITKGKGDEEKPQAES